MKLNAVVAVLAPIPCVKNGDRIDITAVFFVFIDGCIAVDIDCLSEIPRVCFLSAADA